MDGLEPSTLRLSGVRSNHLSYMPAAARRVIHAPGGQRNAGPIRAGAPPSTRGGPATTTVR